MIKTQLLYTLFGYLINYKLLFIHINLVSLKVFSKLQLLTQNYLTTNHF